MTQLRKRKHFRLNYQNIVFVSSHCKHSEAGREVCYYCVIFQFEARDNNTFKAILNSSAAGSASKLQCLEDNKSQNVNVLSIYRFFRTSRKYV